MASNIMTVDQLLQTGIVHFTTNFKTEPTIVGCAPGRVNLIGEHTDYNDGFVLPMALPLVTLVIGRKSKGLKCTVQTTSTEVNDVQGISFFSQPKKDLLPGSCQWGNYIKGVIAKFPAPVPGFDAVIVSSVPIGGGLSSSAALEVALYTFLEALVQQQTEDLPSKALACQQAENEFANVPCGIMDQFVSVMGKENHALLIDCRSPMTVELIKMCYDGITILVTDSGVKHNLGSSEYPLRKEQCQKAASLLKVTSLRDASLVDIQALEESSDIPPEVILKRARHVISEISRTYLAATALKAKDFSSFGLLMQQSHNSLRDDYEVSCQELDKIVSLTMSCDGVFGCRMTGGGFGGCTVTLLKKEAVERVIDTIKKNYQGVPKFYVVTPSEGARIIPIKTEEKFENQEINL